MPILSFRKAINWYKDVDGKPYVFFALDDVTREVYLCVVVKSYTPVQHDGLPDIFVCRKIDRKQVRNIPRMRLNDLSVFMRLTFSIYTFESDCWTPRGVQAQQIDYGMVPDNWWPSSMDELILDIEEVY